MSVSKVVAGRARCAVCSEHRELRPYGKGGSWVCFPCAMKDEDTAKAEFGKMLDADTTIVDATFKES